MFWGSSGAKNYWTVAVMIPAQAVGPRLQIRHSGVHRLFEHEIRVRPPLLELEEGTPQSYWQIACDLKPAKSVATGKLLSYIQVHCLGVPTTSFSP